MPDQYKELQRLLFQLETLYAQSPTPTNLDRIAVYQAELAALLANFHPDILDED